MKQRLFLWFFRMCDRLDLLYQGLSIRDQRLLLLLFPLIFGIFSWRVLIPWGDQFSANFVTLYHHHLETFEHLRNQMINEQKPIDSSDETSQLALLVRDQEDLHSQLEHLSPPASSPLLTLLEMSQRQHLLVHTITEPQHHQWEIKAEGSYEEVIAFLHHFSFEEPLFWVQQLSLEEHEGKLVVECTIRWRSLDE